MSRANVELFYFLWIRIFCCPSGDAWDAGSWYIVPVPLKGKWAMENGDQGGDPRTSSRRLFCVWLTKTKKESLYAVHESSSAVKYHLPGTARGSLVWCHLIIAYLTNGEWRIANGERHWAFGQESTNPATPSGDPSSREEIQGQWTITDLSDRWRMENGQWSLRINWCSSREGPWQVQIRDSQACNVDLSTLFDVPRS